MIKHLLISCGYVEGNYVSILAFNHVDGGCETLKDAVTSLALDMYAKFAEDNPNDAGKKRKRKACCLKAIKKDSDANFCSVCGTRIQVVDYFDVDKFVEYVQNLHSSTCDSYGDGEHANGRSLEWWPFGSEFMEAEKSEVAFLSESAEVTLLYALLEANPEIKVEERALEDFECYSNHWQDILNEKSDE